MSEVPLYTEPVAVVRSLLVENADVTLSDKQGSTCLHFDLTACIH